MSNKADYLAYIQQSYDRDQGLVEEENTRWRSQFNESTLFRYSATRLPLQVGVVAAFLDE